MRVGWWVIKSVSLHSPEKYLPLASFTQVLTAGAWPYRVL